MLVLLDRDGVINEDTPNYIKSPDEWHPIPGSLEAIARLNRAGCVVVVCTNQSGVGRQIFTEEALHAIHRRMSDALATVAAHLDAVLFCPHAPDANCDCRKPRPKLLLNARARFPLAAARGAFFIGDTVRDAQAALAASCTPIHLRTGNGARDEAQVRALGVALVFDDLAAAADWVIACQA